MNRFRLNVLLIALAFTFAFTQVAHAAAYEIDHAHSTIGFSVKHLMVSEVSGAFTDYKGTVNFDPANLPASTVDVVIQTASINTNNDKRDAHLKTADFFDAEKYPTITFKSKEIKKEGEQYVIAGDLTMHGVTKTISLPCTINGPVTNPMGGGQVIGLSGQTTVNRQDFGVSWNKQMDQGGYVVDNNVVLNINVEAHGQK